jgi:F-type H+-transporting ATPase subunit epsilon
VWLKLLLPTEILADEEVTKVIAEADNGSFCLLPRHVDFVAPLVPGILTYTSLDGGEQLIAVDVGTLVKCGPTVLVSTRNAVRGTDLEHLRAAVEHSFQKLDEQERLARTALARLEAGTIRRFIALEERFRG